MKNSKEGTQRKTQTTSGARIYLFAGFDLFGFAFHGASVNCWDFKIAEVEQEKRDKDELIK